MRRYAPIGHTHEATSVAWGDVTGKPTEFTPVAHTHTVSEITDLSLSGYLPLTGGTLTGDTTLSSKLRLDADGYIMPHSTNTRSAGLYGNYDSTRKAHIWSIGTNFRIAEDGSTFGNLYGMAYQYDGTDGHQIVFCNNGSVNARISVTDGDAWFGTIYEGGTSLASKYAGISHTHTYLPLTGGTLTGSLTMGEFSWATMPGSSGNSTARALLGFSDDRTDRYGAIGTYRGAASTRIGLSFWCSYDAAPVERLRLDELGNLRILSGDLYLSGTMQSGTVPWARLSGVPSYLSDGSTATSLNIGNADTTLTRKAAGSLGVENRAAVVMASTSYTQSRITVSTSDPSGGVNGDIWLKV